MASRLALGMGAAAYEGALEVGDTVVDVLGCGIDVAYLKSNRRLFERVAQSGAIVSEYYLGEPPLQYHFLARNSIISGLSDGVRWS